jgi:hypothetical protein
MNGNSNIENTYPKFIGDAQDDAMNNGTGRRTQARSSKG